MEATDWVLDAHRLLAESQPTDDDALELWQGDKHIRQAAQRVIAFEIVVLGFSLWGTSKHFHAAGDTIGPVAQFQIVHACFAFSQVMVSVLFIVGPQMSMCTNVFVTITFERIALLTFCLMWLFFVRYWDTVFLDPRTAKRLHFVRKWLYVFGVVCQVGIQLKVAAELCHVDRSVFWTSYIMNRMFFSVICVDAFKLFACCVSRDCGMYDDTRHLRFLQSFRSGMKHSAEQQLTFKDEPDRAAKASSPWWKRRYVRHAAANFAIAVATGYRGFVELIYAAQADAHDDLLAHRIGTTTFAGSLALPFLVPSLLALILMWKRTYLSPVDLRPTTVGILSNTISNMLLLAAPEPDSTEHERNWLSELRSDSEVSMGSRSFRASSHAGRYDPTRSAIEEFQKSLQHQRRTLKATHKVMGLQIDEHCEPSALAFAITGLYIRDVALPTTLIESSIRTQRTSGLLDACMPKQRDNKSMSQLQEQAQYEELIRLCNDVQEEEKAWVELLENQAQILGPSGGSHSLGAIDPTSYFKPSREKNNQMLSLFSTNLHHHHTIVRVCPPDPAGTSNPMMERSRSASTELDRRLQQRRSRASSLTAKSDLPDSSELPPTMSRVDLAGDLSPPGAGGVEETKQYGPRLPTRDSTESEQADSFASSMPYSSASSPTMSSSLPPDVGSPLTHAMSLQQPPEEWTTQQTRSTLAAPQRYHFQRDVHATSLQQASEEWTTRQTPARSTQAAPRRNHSRRDLLSRKRMTFYSSQRGAAPSPVVMDNPAARAPDVQKGVAEATTITYGAPSGHALGFLDGSLGNIEREMKKLDDRASTSSLSPMMHAQRLRLIFKRRQREIVCVGQALPAAVAACAEVVLAAVNRQDEVLVGQIGSIGMLLHECSLLSTRGKENMMLDDMREALNRMELIIVLERDYVEPELKDSLDQHEALEDVDLEAANRCPANHRRSAGRANVASGALKIDDIRVGRVRSPSLDLARDLCEGTSTKAMGTGIVLVNLLIPPEHFDWVASVFPTEAEVSRFLSSERQTKGLDDLPSHMPIIGFRVLPVLFTQGVNEQQSLSNQFGSAGLQDKINSDGLSTMIDYHTEFVRHHLDRLLGSVGADDTLPDEKGSHVIELRDQRSSNTSSTRTSTPAVEPPIVAPSATATANRAIDAAPAADQAPAGPDGPTTPSSPTSPLSSLNSLTSRTSRRGTLVRGMSSLSALADFQASWGKSGNRHARHQQRVKAAMWRVLSTPESQSEYLNLDQVDAWAEDLLALDLMLVHLRALVNRQSEAGGKNVDLLVASAACARMMNAARTTSCKSAKDRTSMFQSLEVCRLASFLGLLPSNQLHQMQPVLDELRGPHGVRLANCKLNTGKAFYAFSDLQLKVFPTELVPPTGTYGSTQT